MSWVYNPFTGQLDRVGTSSGGGTPSSDIAIESTLNAGANLSKADPVKTDSSGNIDLVDVSVEADIKGFVGLTKENVSSGSSVLVIHAGRLENVTTIASVGDFLYIDKSGGLTNTQPEEGVAGFVSGDYVVLVGKVLQNNSVPANKDILVNIQIIGQL